MQMHMFWFPKCKCFDANALGSKNTNGNVAFSNANAFEPKPGSDICLNTGNET